jgi:hypothetical protein
MLEAVMQSVALCAYGNAFIDAPDHASMPPGYIHFSVFKHIAEYSFERCTPGYRGGPLGSLPSQWLKRLKAEEAHSMKLTMSRFDVHHAHSMPSGDGRGPAIITEGSAGIEVWTSGWKYRGSMPDGRDWKVSYASERGNRSFQSAQRSCAELSAELIDRVAKLSDKFASLNQKTWQTRFNALVNLHEQRQHLIERYSDVLPAANFGFEARLLLANAVRSYMVLTSNEFRNLRLADDSPMHHISDREVWSAVCAGFETVVSSYQSGSSKVQAA